MTKKEYCNTHPATAYYSGFNGLEIHGIEYGINDYLYCVSGELVKLWNGWTATTGRHIQAFCGLNKTAYMNL